MLRRTKASCLGERLKSTLANPALPCMVVGYVPPMAVQLLCGGVTSCWSCVVVVVGLRNDGAGAVGKLHDRRHGQQVLIESGIEEDAVFANGSAERASELLLAVVGLFGGIRLPGIEVAIAK